MADDATQLTGTIKSIKPTYGFIRGPDGHDYFFHGGSLDPMMKIKGMAIPDLLQIGDRVTFDPLPGEEGKGPRAAQVRKIT